jgi:hypothetical protein
MKQQVFMTKPPDSPPTRPNPKSIAATSGETRFFITSDLEDAIAQMPKVHGARIVSDDSGIEEIHVISANDIAPKALVRNILTLLLVRFGLRVDRRTISIVQSDQEPYVQVGRPIIQQVRVIAQGGEKRVAVELRSPNGQVRGTHTLQDGESEMQGGCMALIDAVERLIGRQQILRYGDAQAVRLQEREVVVVLVTWHGSRVDETFTGSAFADSGYASAAARATLDAINRKLVRLPIMVEN